MEKAADTNICLCVPNDMFRMHGVAFSALQQSYFSSLEYSYYHSNVLLTVVVALLAL